MTKKPETFDPIPPPNPKKKFRGQFIDKLELPREAAPAPRTFTLEERFDALQQLVANLGADVRRCEAEVERAFKERDSAELLGRCLSLMNDLMRGLPDRNGQHKAHGSHVLIPINTYVLTDLSHSVSDFLKTGSKG